MFGGGGYGAATNSPGVATVRLTQRTKRTNSGP